MVKSSDLLKIFLVIQIVEFSCAMPMSDDSNYENAVSENLFAAKMVQMVILNNSQQYEQEIAGWIPVPAAYIASQGYWPTGVYKANHNYPSFNERAKLFQTAPSKRNSELINSLLGLPKNMDQVGK